MSTRVLPENITMKSPEALCMKEYDYEETQNKSLVNVGERDANRGLRTLFKSCLFHHRHDNR